MTESGQSDGPVLCWPRRLLSADDLRRHLTSQRELQLLPRTVVTPLAADELKSRGVRVSWQAKASEPATSSAKGPWAYAQERPDAVVDSVVKALERDGIVLAALRLSAGATGPWARQLAETIGSSDCLGAVAFCADAGLVCCVANKVAGVRAVPLASVAQAAKASNGLAANLLAVETAGRSFFELRQMLRTACTDSPVCPEDVANVLKELDGHAHR